jgi:hypothetical protein
MFFYDQKHNYVYGLDPHYLYTKNPELSKQIGEITGGKIDDPGPIIREKYGARYVYSDAKENQDFIAKLLESGWGEMIYDDDEAIILKIRDEKGLPPDDSQDDGNDDAAPADDAKTDEEPNSGNKNANVNAGDEDDEEQ